MSVPGLSLSILKKKTASPQPSKESPRENSSAKDDQSPSARKAKGKQRTPRGREKKEAEDFPQEVPEMAVVQSRKSFDSSTEMKPCLPVGAEKELDHPVDSRLAKVQPTKPKRKGSMILDSLSLEDNNKNSPAVKRKGTGKKKEEEVVHHYFVLRIEEARGLRKGDIPLLGHINPYCIFDIIPSGIIGARTSVVRWEANPQWREQFVGNRYFGLDGKPKPESFSITVMDKNSLSSDECLGKAIIPFAKNIDQWFPLEGEKAQGELRVVLRFFTSEEGIKLYNIFKEEASVETLCARWEKEVVALQESRAAESTEQEKEAESIRIPVFDVPCFVSVNKIWTLFQLAVFKDNPDLVKHLHELGCNINARDQTGNTALHIAAVKKHQALMRMLSRMGVDVKVQNYLGGKDYKEMMAMFIDDDDTGSYML